MFFWNSLPFSIIQQMLAIWSLVPLPFLNLACASGSSWFTYCWRLAWGILSITLLGCEMSTIVVGYWIFIRIVCDMHLLSAELLHSAYTFSSVQLSRVWLIATPWTPARQASLSCRLSDYICIFFLFHEFYFFTPTEQGLVWAPQLLNSEQEWEP